MKFVLMHLPGKVTYKEIDEMIETVDRNGDGKISFSEFRFVEALYIHLNSGCSSLLHSSEFRLFKFYTFI
jgi:hypothetical protein